MALKEEVLAVVGVSARVQLAGQQGDPLGVGESTWELEDQNQRQAVVFPLQCVPITNVALVFVVDFPRPFFPHHILRYYL